HNNQGFEALTLVGDETLVAGTEGPLLQDQPPPTGELVRSRLLRWDLRRPALPAQWLYPLDPPHAVPTEPDGVQVAGLVDLLPWDGRLLALERSYVAGVGTAVKLYETTFAGVAAVDEEALARRRAPTLRKRLLLDLAALGAPIDNYEAMSWLPAAGGKRLLVILCDNNFSPTEQTHMLAVALDARPELPQAPLADPAPAPAN
ncbi:MAG TPA: esterase-like activity of phytase family protein, partial [Thermoanaerobaculia bacterium]|nr:esterase-like activity of phytase family protein [Thermoanaerobaculia bacterium]